MGSRAPRWPTPAGALFEAGSGFTTTGATVVADVETLSRATNLWRCLMHWLGGMGIVVLFVALFPQLGVGAKLLFRSEVPGPITEGLRPKIKQTAMALWWIYSALMVGLGFDLVSATSGTVACLSSVGPGLSDLGPTQNFGIVPASGKLVLSMCMIAGRLEIFALLATWRCGLVATTVKAWFSVSSSWTRSA